MILSSTVNLKIEVSDYNADDCHIHCRFNEEGQPHCILFNRKLYPSRFERYKLTRCLECVGVFGLQDDNTGEDDD